MVKSQSNGKGESDVANAISAKHTNGNESKEEEERRAKMRKEAELKQMIARELDKIKALEEENIRKKKEAEQKKKLEEARAKIRREEDEKLKVEREKRRREEEAKKIDQARIRVQQEIKALKDEQDRQYREEIRRAQKEAEERNLRIQREEEERKRERELKMKKAVEEEMKKLAEEEELAKERKREEERRKRAEEARRIEEEIERRKQEELERQKRAKEEMEAQKKRDLEEVKRKMHEHKMNKFKKETEKAAAEAAGAAAKPQLEKRRRSSAANNNPLLQRFEELSKTPQVEEQVRMAQIAEKRKNKKPFVLKVAGKEALKKSTNLLAKALSKEVLKSGGKGSKALLKALSKEMLKSPSREKMKKSREKLRSSSSREVIFKTGSKGSLHGSRAGGMNKLSRSKSSQGINLDPSSVRQKSSSGKDMKSYLISQVLFDGEENVQAAAKMRLTGVEEEEQNDDSNMRDKDVAEIRLQEHMFEAYKSEMEKYLSLFDEGGNKKKAVKKSNRVTMTKKAVVPIVGNVKSKFEHQELGESKPVKTDVKVGKLDSAKVFENSPAEVIPKRKASFAPVVIDPDAFSRTMNQFEHYRQEEEERERRRLAEEERRREVAERRRREEEERRRLEEEEERRRRMEAEAEEEEEEEWMSAAEEEEETEVELTEEEKVARMSMKERIQYELAKLADQERESRERIARENRKRELIRQIQEQMDKIKGLDVTKTKPAAPSSDETPVWIKLIEKADLKSSMLQKKPDDQANNENKLSSNAVCEMVEMLSNSSRSQPDSADNNVDSKPPMTYEESVSALLALIDEEKGKDSKAKGKKSKAKPNVKVNVNLVHDAKSRLEELTSSASPTSPPPNSAGVVGPYEINNVHFRKAKESLLKNLESEGDAKPLVAKGKEKGLFSKKCSDIKDMLTKRTTSNKAHKADEVTAKKKKKVIQVAVEPSIEEQLSMKKERNKSHQWAYQAKSPEELALLNNDQPNTKRREEITSKANVVRKEIEELQREREYENQGTDIDDFMRSVESYMSVEATTEQEQAFKSTIQGYLDLIEHRKVEHKDRPNRVNVGKLSKAFQFSDDQQDESKIPKRPLAVGKLDVEAFQAKTDGSDNAPGKHSAVSKRSCEAVKAMLEHKTASKDAGAGELKNLNRKKLIDINVRQQNALVPDSERKTEWRWKQKQPEITALQNYVKSERRLEAKLVSKVRNSDTEELSRKSEELTKSIEAKEKEFELLMQELQDVGSNAEQFAEDNLGITSYLELIDDAGKKLNSANSALPHLTAQPWKIDDIKTKMKQSPQQVNKQPSKSKQLVGKITNFALKSVVGGTKEEDKQSSVAVAVNTDKVRRMFEENSKLGAGNRAVSDLNLAPRKKRVVLDAPAMMDKMLLPLQRRRTVRRPFVPRAQPTMLQPLNDNLRVPDSVPTRRANDENAGWKSITDPEERKRAILQKHGFKPRDSIKSADNDKTLDEELGLIPDHIMNDEILYRKYMNRELGLDSTDSSSSDGDSSMSSPELTRKNSNKKPSGSASSLLNILGNMRKAAVQKASKESRRQYAEAVENANRPRQATSEMDLSQVPGSCDYLRRRFDAGLHSEGHGDGHIKDYTGGRINADMRKRLQEHFSESTRNQQSFNRDEIGIRTGGVAQARNILESGPSTDLTRRFSLADEATQGNKEAFLHYRNMLEDGADRRRPVKSFIPGEIAKSKSCMSMKQLWESEMRSTNESGTASRPFVRDFDESEPVNIAERRKSLEHQLQGKGGDDRSREFVRPGKKNVSRIRGALSSEKWSQSDVAKYFAGPLEQARTAQAKFQEALQKMSDAPPPSMFETTGAVQRSNSCNSMKQMWEQQMNSTLAMERKSSFGDLNASSGSLIVGGAKAFFESAADAENSTSGGGHRGWLQSELEAVKAARARSENTDHQPTSLYQHQFDGRQRMQLELEEIRRARRWYDEEEAEEERGGMSERDRMQLELAALRQLREKTGLSKITRGNRGSGGLQRTSSAHRLNSDLDDDTMRGVRANNAAVKAMFESSGPKYRFGGAGGGGRTTTRSESDVRRGPARRPSLRPREERRWVLDTINKYFEVIQEEGSEEEDEDRNEDTDDEDDDENKEIYYPDSEEDESESESIQASASKGNLRHMFDHVVSKVSRTVGGSKEALISRFKHNLGSQLSINDE